MVETTEVRGCCPLDCQDSCSWVATVEDGQVIRVEGARDHPFTRGVLCAKVNDYPERTYSPDRILHPLRRIGAKGSGEFDRMSWDEAIDTIARRFTDIIDKHGPEALMPLNDWGSMGVVQWRALMRLFHALGASRFHGSLCGAAGNVVVAEGHPTGFDPEELIHSQLILLWGSNILSTSHHHWHFMQLARKTHGARIICIDPRRTRTAKASDEHIAIRPGTDAVLAAGLAGVMLDEGIADLEFAGQAASDLPDYMDKVAKWSPNQVADICGIDVETVVRLAREFGSARPATIRSGIGPQQSKQGEEFVRSISALAFLGGHWKLPGGGLFIEAYPEFYAERAMRTDLLEGEPRSLDKARLGETLTDPYLTPPIKGLMMWGINPAVSQPDTKTVRAGLERDDLFTVVLEHFVTDTARYADIVLPSTTQLEHFDIQGAWGHHYISLNNPAVSPQGESKSHGEVMRLLATRMGLSHPALQESDEQIAASALPSDVDLATLKASGWHKTSLPRPTFPSEENKVRLSDGVPSPPDATLGANTLQLLTPKAHYFLNSSFANMPRQRNGERRPTLDMNPFDAAARHLRDGQEIIVKNSQGEVLAWLRVTDDVRPGVASLPGKWWSTPPDTGAVGNFLTPASWAPGGQPAFNETFVEVLEAG